VVAFSHPLCSDCQELSRRLEGEGRAPVVVDVSRRPDLARKYGVAVVPLAVAVGPDGRVLRRIPARRT
jgi:thioredoxin-like negative regulator of GroEL